VHIVVDISSSPEFIDMGSEGKWKLDMDELVDSG